MLKWIISFLTFSLLLGGQDIESVPPCRVVTKVSVEWTENSTNFQRIYTDQDKMNKLLIYLRTLKPQIPTELPEISDGPEYRILLELNDGSQVRYAQYGLSFFSKNEGPWQVIDSDRAVRLALIVEAFPSDFDF